MAPVVVVAAVLKIWVFGELLSVLRGAVASLPHFVAVWMVVTSAYLLPRGAGFEIVIDEPLTGFPATTPEGDAEKMNEAIERCVRRAPTQYFWVHKRFKTRPPGSPDIYD